jgi:hypothetical protein
VRFPWFGTTPAPASEAPASEAPASEAPASGGRSPVPAGSGIATAWPGEARRWDPLPAIGKFVARFTAGKVAGFLGSLVVLPIVVAAARATHGWVHLFLGLGVCSAFMALAQSAGALVASRGTSAAAPLALTFKYWFVLPLFALWPLLGLAGIADDDRQPMLSGVAVGVVVVLALWVIWALIANRRPGLEYHPGGLKGRRWYLRVTMNAGGLIGGLAAIGVIKR